MTPGISNAEYYAKSDVWPLDPDGEILVGIMIEDQLAVENLPDILDRVPGIGLVLVGEGDMSQELGIPRQYDHPRMLEAKRRILKICAERDVAVGHPHVTAANIEQVLDEGYRFLMSAPVRTDPGPGTGPEPDRPLVMTTSAPVNARTSESAMLIDCHGHFTTAAPALGRWRDRQIRAFEESGARWPAAELRISDDEIVTAVAQGQLKLQQERGVDIALFSPGAGKMAHHYGTRRPAWPGRRSATT